MIKTPFAKCHAQGEVDEHGSNDGGVVGVDSDDPLPSCADFGLKPVDGYERHLRGRVGVRIASDTA